MPRYVIEHGFDDMRLRARCAYAGCDWVADIVRGGTLDIKALTEPSEC